MQKLSENQLIGSAAQADAEFIKSVRRYEKFAIQLNYSTGTGTTASLQASLDYNSDTGAGNWVEIPNTSQALGNDGGTHIWNVVDSIFPYVKIVVEGDAADLAAYFSGDEQPRRG